MAYSELPRSGDDVVTVFAIRTPRANRDLMDRVYEAIKGRTSGPSPSVTLSLCDDSMDEYALNAIRCARTSR